MKTLIIAEHHEGRLNTSTLSTVAAAQQLKFPLELLIIGNQCQAVVDQAKKIAGLQRILVADHTTYEKYFAENTAPLVVEIAHSYSHVLAPATTLGKDLMPRVAALLDVPLVSDVIQMVNDHTFIRPIYAGNARATIVLQEAITLLTVRTSSFNTVNLLEIPQEVPVEKISSAHTATLTTFVKEEASRSERPELTSARVVIAGGRGLQSGENFKLLESLAIKLNAAIGASRAAVDAGFIANDFQVGQTGKIVAPDLYIAVGISGAIQHIAGMKDSKVIVAINKDPDAPIFQIADYGLVGDLFEILPALEELLTKQIGDK